MKFARSILRLVGFLGFYILAVIKSNLRVASDVLRPSPRIHPGWVDLPLEPISPGRRFVLANLITMTPGTLVVDGRGDKRGLLIHTLYVEDTPDNMRRSWSHNFERRVRDSLR